MERVLELANIAANKNTVPGDVSALVPGGLRVGTPAITTRGMDEVDVKQIVDFIDRGVSVSKTVQEGCGSKKLKDFLSFLGDGSQNSELMKLKQEVVALARDFPFLDE